MARSARDGSLCHLFRGGKVQIARDAMVNSGVTYGMLVPTVVDPHTDPGEEIEATFRQSARWRDMFRGGGSHRRLAHR